MSLRSARLVMPSMRMLAVLGLGLLVAVLASIVEQAQALWWYLVGLTAVIAALDLSMALGMRAPDFRRRHGHTLAVGVDSEIELELRHQGRSRLALEVFDLIPPLCQSKGLPQRLSMAPDSGALLRYQLHPVQRGDMAFSGVDLRLHSPFGLWRVRVRVAEHSAFRVYPNFAAIQRYVLLATDHRLSQIGILSRRRRGEGQDFHQLRDYRLGDAPRQIDWRATARMRRVVARDYRDERDQQLLLLLDCSRRMHARDGALSHLDHALNAALLLAHVALRQGDAVGMMTFGGDTRYVPPRKSQAQIQHLLARVFDLQSSLHAPDYYQAAVQLLRQQRKRSLVVLVSNLRDEDDSGLFAGVQLLRQRHLVVVASLREQILDAALRAPTDTLDAALTQAATAQYLEQRKRGFALLQASKIPCLDVEPQNLAVALINHYQDMKRRGAI